MYFIILVMANNKSKVLNVRSIIKISLLRRSATFATPEKKIFHFLIGKPTLNKRRKIFAQRTGRNI